MLKKDPRASAEICRSVYRDLCRLAVQANAAFADQSPALRITTQEPLYQKTQDGKGYALVFSAKLAFLDPDEAIPLNQPNLIVEYNDDALVDYFTTAAQSDKRAALGVSGAWNTAAVHKFIDKWLKSNLPEKTVTAIAPQTILELR